MIVVMSHSADQKQVDLVCNYLDGRPGLRAHASQGIERVIIGVIGQIYPELQSELEQLDGVGEVIRISRPYKLSGRDFHPSDTVVESCGVSIGDEVVVMAGPCSVETEGQIIEAAHAVRSAGAQFLRGGAFKPRTSPYSFRGLGVQGLRLLAKAREETGLGIITEVMTAEDVGLVEEYTDIFQVGARNVQNFILLDALGKASKPVLLKRGFSTSYEDWLLCAEYVLAGGNSQVILGERGIRTFETYTRNTLDLAAIPVIKRLSHLPIMIDPSHATGFRDKVASMARAAVAAGADGLMVEVHHDPEKAMSDGPQSLFPDQFVELIEQLRQIAQTIGRTIA